MPTLLLRLHQAEQAVRLSRSINPDTLRLTKIDVLTHNITWASYQVPGAQSIRGVSVGLEWLQRAVYNTDHNDPFISIFIQPASATATSPAASNLVSDDVDMEFGQAVKSIPKVFTAQLAVMRYDTVLQRVENVPLLPVDQDKLEIMLSFEYTESDYF